MLMGEQNECWNDGVRSEQDIQVGQTINEVAKKKEPCIAGKHSITKQQMETPQETLMGRYLQSFQPSQTPFQQSKASMLIEKEVTLSARCSSALESLSN